MLIHFTKGGGRGGTQGSLPGRLQHSRSPARRTAAPPARTPRPRGHRPACLSAPTPGAKGREHPSRSCHGKGSRVNAIRPAPPQVVKIIGVPCDLLHQEIKPAGENHDISSPGSLPRPRRFPIFHLLPNLCFYEHLVYTLDTLHRAGLYYGKQAFQNCRCDVQRRGPF